MKLFRAIAFVACMFVMVSPVSAQADDTAALQVLSDTDIAHYRAVFDLQERANWRDADKEIAEIDDDILMGYVQFQRYMHPTGYRSSYPELKRWMAYYADHPEANTVYKLAMKRRPRGASAPVRWTSRKWRSAEAQDLHPDIQADYAKTSRPRLRAIEGRVRYLSNKERALDALKEIERHHSRNVITTRQFDRMRSWIAASLYYQGYVDAARRISAEAANRNGETAVLAHWIAGLIAFRDNDIDTAHDHFMKMAAVPYQDGALRSAAGFWRRAPRLAPDRWLTLRRLWKLPRNIPSHFMASLHSHNSVRSMTTTGLHQLLPKMDWQS